MESPLDQAKRRAGKGAKGTESLRAVDVTIGGETWRWWHPMTVRLTAELRRVTGKTLADLWAEVSGAQDVDTWATLIWLARRDAGENVTLDDVFDELDTLDITDVRVRMWSEVELAGDDSPEA